MIDYLIGAFLGALFMNIMNNNNNEIKQLENENNKKQEEALDLFKEEKN